MRYLISANLRLAALFGIALLTLTAHGCGEEDANNEQTSPNNQEQTAVEENTQGEQPQESDTPRSDDPKDVRLATDVLTLLVTNEQVDARHFSVTVVDGTAHLAPTDNATEDEQQEAATLAQSVEGISAVNIDGEPAPHMGAEASKTVAEHVEQAQDNDASDQPSTDTADTQEDGSKEAEKPIAETTSDKEEAEAAEQAGTPPEIEDTEENEKETADDTKIPEKEANEGSDPYRSYTIQRGDTLSVIAARELGNGARWNEIYELNKDVIGPNPDGIRDGMVIKLPTE